MWLSFCLMLRHIGSLLVQLAIVRSIEVAPVAAEGCFQWFSSDGGLKTWRYPCLEMIAYEIDFRDMGYRVPMLRKQP